VKSIVTTSNRSTNGSSPNESTGDSRSDSAGKLSGFGHYSRRTFKIERLLENLPIIIELVDTADKIDSFLSFIEHHIRRNS
jgi:hypothetical protein